MKIYNVTDEKFRPYGKVLEGYDWSEILEKMEDTLLPEDVVYVPSEEALESTKAAFDLEQKGFGGLPIQIGYCNGKNDKLNALEYHRSSEINVAATDMILLLGRQQDISEEGIYNTENVEAFLVPKGTGIEIYATTLHYAPCGVDGNSFRCVVVLPKGTNTELEREVSKEGEDRLMTAKNKWLIAHKEAGIEGAFEGLIGENLCVK